jgi:hypothetical protein
VAVHGHQTLAAQRSPPSLLTSTYVIADRTTPASQLIGDVRSWVALCDTVLPPTRPVTLISCPVSMRLLQINGDGDLSLVEYFGSDIPRYAILSHTWGADDDEISFKDVKKNRARSKPSGYHKVRFCGEQALRDGIHFFWVDTCCIKQESSQEVGEAINSMYRWYHNAVTCYVYLTDVTVTNPTRQGTDSEPVWYSAFLSSKWFTRGWTLQELLAPVSIEFFSQEGDRLGDRTTLLSQIQWITKIPEAALRGTPLSTFAVEERISWARTRVTKREEDAAYSLLGLFGIHMPLIYGEGRRNALKRLQREIVNNSKEEPLSPFLSSSSVVASSTTAPHPSGNLATSVSSPADYAGRKSFSRAPTLHTVLDVRFGFRIDEIRPVFDSGLRGNSTNIRVNEGVSGKWWTCGSSIHQATVPSLVSRHFDTVTVYYESERYTVMRGGKTISLSFYRSAICIIRCLTLTISLEFYDDYADFIRFRCHVLAYRKGSGLELSQLRS